MSPASLVCFTKVDCSHICLEFFFLVWVPITMSYIFVAYINHKIISRSYLDSMYENGKNPGTGLLNALLRVTTTNF